MSARRRKPRAQAFHAVRINIGQAIGLAGLVMGMVANAWRPLTGAVLLGLARVMAANGVRIGREVATRR